MKRRESYDWKNEKADPAGTGRVSKRIQELQQEADRLKNYSFIHESDQKLIHNLRLQAEGHKYAINLLREKNIQLKKRGIRTAGADFRKK